MLIIVFLLSFCATLLLLENSIKYFKVVQKKGQPIRVDGPSSHFSKAGTPTLGGIIFIPVIVLLTLIFTKKSQEVLLLIFILLSYGVIGFFDDISKIKNNSSKGMKAKFRLLLEFIIAFIVIYFIQKWKGTSTIKIAYTTLDLGWLYYLLASFVIVGTANATNFTDGIDGLLIGSNIVICTAFTIIIAKNFPSLVDIKIMLFIVVSISLAFLWYNAYPAKIFMGDTGSLAIGGLIGTVTLLIGCELPLIVMAGLYLAETISVIAQVLYYKKTGKRLFLMAPLHHHFEKKGIVEPLLVVRLWIVHLLLVIIGTSLALL
jgi:phospho-N-acetylmuramoyl-pentapeptide-transferase